MLADSGTDQPRTHPGKEKTKNDTSASTQPYIHRIAQVDTPKVYPNAVETPETKEELPRVAPGKEVGRLPNNK